MTDVFEVYARAGLRNRIKFGTHPALIVVDIQVGFTCPEKSPLAGKLDREIEQINKLIEVCRGKGFPIIFTVIAYEDPNFKDGGVWIEKAPTLKILTRGGGLDELDPRLNASPDDTVVIKKFASAFFGTNLVSILNYLGVDSLLVTGCTTSGCLRATVVDGLQNGFRVMIPRETAGDRAPGPHEAALFDMDSKYGDVVSVTEAVAYLERL